MIKPNRKDQLLQKTIKCYKCLKTIKNCESFSCKDKLFCEDCAMEIRMHRSRKTHWQYLRSIKVEYLIPGKRF